jgi:hypothetical protein
VTTDTDPAQTDEVVRAIEEALGSAEPGPDPWWQAGTEEALEE